jgi:hypothetical protein
LADEVRYIQHRAANYDGRVVTFGQLVSSPGEFSPDRAAEKLTFRYAGGTPSAA